MIISEIYFFSFLQTIRILGYRLVWTAHNITPHEETFLDDQKMSIYLAGQADKIILLNKNVASTFKLDHPKFARKVAVIPQGNYLSYYNFGSDQIDQSKLIFGFVGQIKPYKGLHLLIPIIRKIKNPKLQLLIVGKCTDQKYLHKLVRLAGTDKRITIENRYVAQSELGNIVASFGVMVLPFTSITNSSTAMLAFSAGRTILTPRIGGMQDYPLNTGFYYNPNNLAGAVKQAIESRDEWEMMGKHALAFAERNDWVSVATETVKIYLDLAY